MGQRNHLLTLDYRTGILSAYQIEILPYALRAKGNVIASFVILVFSSINIPTASLWTQSAGSTIYSMAAFLGLKFLWSGDMLLKRDILRWKRLQITLIMIGQTWLS